jgi:hypothetical protein
LSLPATYTISGVVVLSIRLQRWLPTYPISGAVVLQTGLLSDDCLHVLSVAL